jgi:hydrogenase expression/formation protein HypC
MCLAVPARVIEIKDKVATVEILGEKRKVRISSVKPKVGDYVLIQSGFVVGVADKKTAEESLKLWNRL